MPVTYSKSCLLPEYKVVYSFYNETIFLQFTKLYTTNNALANESICYECYIYSKPKEFDILETYYTMDKCINKSINGFDLLVSEMYLPQNNKLVAKFYYLNTFGNKRFFDTVLHEKQRFI